VAEPRSERKQKTRPNGKADKFGERAGKVYPPKTVGAGKSKSKGSGGETSDVSKATVHHPGAPKGVHFVKATPNPHRRWQNRPRRRESFGGSYAWAQHARTALGKKKGALRTRSTKKKKMDKNPLGGAKRSGKIASPDAQEKKGKTRNKTKGQGKWQKSPRGG